MHTVKSLRTWQAVKRAFIAALLTNGLLLSVLAASATAAPALFTGVGKQAGGIIGYTSLITTLTGPTSGNPGIASVDSVGGLTVPASAFSRATPGYTFDLLPVYPYIYLKISAMNQPGAFAPSFLTPNVPVVGPITNTVQPAVTGTPRAGFVRVTPGPNGFGGEMPLEFVRTYQFDIATSLGILKAFASGGVTLGYGPLGEIIPADKPNGDICCSTYPSGSPSALLTAEAASARGPWMTGMAYAYAPGGAAVTTTTQTAVDARGTGFDTGAISLVTPRLQYIYQGDGAGTLQNLRDNFAVIHSVDFQFAPEPGQIALLASGLMGLVGLARLRRRIV